MIIDQVEFRDGKWYCKKCGKEVKKFEGVAKHNSKYHKKGDILIWFEHMSITDSCKCSNIGRKYNPERGKHISESKKGKSHRGYKMKEESRKKISLSRLGRPPWNKGKKCPQLSAAIKGKPSKLKGKPSGRKGTHLETPEPNTPIDYINYPKEKICTKCGETLYLFVRISKQNRLNYKKGDIIRYEYYHATIELDRKCGDIGHSVTEYNIKNIFNLYTSNIIWSPKRSFIKLSSFKGYPGEPDFIDIKNNIIIEYQGIAGGHNSHPFNPSNPEDIKILNFYKQKSIEFHANSENKGKSCWYDKLILTWTIKDPRKRQWCKDNNIKLIEFWSMDDVYNYLKDYYNISFLPMVI